MGNGLLTPTKLVPPSTELGQPQSTQKTWEWIQNHQLFNKLNNFQPMHVCDCRPSVEHFTAMRVRDAVHTPAPQQVVDSCAKWLGLDIDPSKKILGVRSLTLLLSSDNTESRQAFTLELLALLTKWLEDNNGESVWEVIDPEVLAEATTVDPTAQHTFSLPEPVISAPSVESNGTEVAPPDSNMPTTASCDAADVKSSKKFKLKIFVLPSVEDFLRDYTSCEIMFHKGSDNKKVYNKYFASELIPQFLFLGDYVNATNKEQLEQLGITHLVDATGVRLAEEAATSLNIQYLPIDVDDVETSDLAIHFPATNEFISNAMHSNTLVAIENASSPEKKQSMKKSRVLVHCRAGWSRSPSIVIAFLIHQLRLPLVDAAKLVVRERPMICPNPGFMQQLIDFERSSLSDVSDDIRSKFCPNIMALRLAINEESCLWTTSLTTETNYDRIPIDAFKNQHALESALHKLEYPTESEETSESQTIPKPKKPFLKRGEGKKALPTKPISRASSRRGARYTPLTGENAGENSNSNNVPELLRSESVPALSPSKQNIANAEPHNVENAPVSEA